MFPFTKRGSPCQEGKGRGLPNFYNVSIRVPFYTRWCEYLDGKYISQTFSTVVSSDKMVASFVAESSITPLHLSDIYWLGGGPAAHAVHLFLPNPKRTPPCRSSKGGVILAFPVLLDFFHCGFLRQPKAVHQGPSNGGLVTHILLEFVY